MRLNLQLFKGGVKSGSGAETVDQGNGSAAARYDEIIARGASDWDIAAQVDQGSEVNPFVHELTNMITEMRGQMDDPNFTGRAWFEYDQNPTHMMNLRSTLASYAGRYGDTDHVYMTQTLDLHTIYMSRQGLADFMTYLRETGYTRYVDYAKGELAAQSKKGRGRKR